MSSPSKDHVLNRSLHKDPYLVTSAAGLYITLADGTHILDASAGAAVASLGHSPPRVLAAVTSQLQSFTYLNTMTFTHRPGRDLAKLLCDSTGGHMTKAYFVGSGSEAIEAALKLARQYFWEIGQKGRCKFISRQQSYHGITLGALGVSGHLLRREKFEPLLNSDMNVRVAACNPYRGMRDGENVEAYVQRLKDELDQAFIQAGPDSVCAFVMEPVVGAASGCVPALPGYLSAAREVCDKHGALLIMDEIICGMGRTGYIHAWQGFDDGKVKPDLQAVGKGLGGGVVPLAGLLMSDRIVHALDRGSGAFVHGHTFQGHALACAAALEAQKVVEEENIANNARNMGRLLEHGLKDGIGSHKHVGNIRGKGLLWGIEFVKDKTTKESFPMEKGVSMGIHELGLSQRFGISLYPATGSAADGVGGDHVIISPPLIVKEEDIQKIVRLTCALVEEYFHVSD